MLVFYDSRVENNNCRVMIVVSPSLYYLHVIKHIGNHMSSK